MSTPTAMPLIRLLLALHPRSWRARYGEELRALLEAAPLTASVVLDVLVNAARQHVRVHAAVLHLTAALAVSIVVKVVAVRTQITDNIVWPPSTVVRAAALAALLVPWLPVAGDLFPARRLRSGVGTGSEFR